MTYDLNYDDLPDNLTDLAKLMEEVYFAAQTDYRHQICDPATCIIEILEKAEYDL